MTAFVSGELISGPFNGVFRPVATLSAAGSAVDPAVQDDDSIGGTTPNAAITKPVPGYQKPVTGDQYAGTGAVANRNLGEPPRRTGGAPSIDGSGVNGCR